MSSAHAAAQTKKVGGALKGALKVFSALEVRKLGTFDSHRLPQQGRLEGSYKRSPGLEDGLGGPGRHHDGARRYLEP